MDTTSSDLIGQRKQRIENTKKLRELGINPFPSIAKRDKTNQEISQSFEKFARKKVALVGRMISKREHGKLIFGNIQDQTGSIQFAIKKDELKENLKNAELGWPQLKLIDAGDFLQITGIVDKTQQGEITLFAQTIKILAKCLRPFPQTFTDKEEQFRKRYIDLVINPKRKELFKRKALFWKASRQFMDSQGFFEVETPVLEHVTGGADANPFVTHHNMLDQDFYLRISTELYQKRLIGGGFEKIYTIGPNFRNEGHSDEHLQEYYQLEWYWAYANYRDNMKLVTKLFQHLARKIYGKTKFNAREHTFDLADEWKEIDYVKIIKEKFNIDIFTDSDDNIRNIIKKERVDLPGTVNRNRLIDNLWKLIRKNISGPAFLINEPAFMSPLAKVKEDDPRTTERFHVIIAGSELGNGYTEINDPQYQLDQFLKQQELREAGDAEAQMLDIDFVEMLEYGMPPTSGYGQSERIFWFFENISGREGTLFPQLKNDIDPMTKELYPQVTFQTNKSAVKPSQNTDLTGLPKRDAAKELLKKHIKELYQHLHAKMVANSMEAYAQEYGENEDLWYITGLLHDLDYDEFPDEHPNHSLKWFHEWNYPQDLIYAVSAHAFGSKRTSTPPKTKFDFTLIACDELCGLLYAYSLMRPTGFAGMEAKSVMKKFKDKAFAAKIDRTEIKMGVEGLGIDLKEHMQKLIGVFQKMEEFKK